MSTWSVRPFEDLLESGLLDSASTWHKSPHDSISSPMQYERGHHAALDPLSCERILEMTEWSKPERRSVETGTELRLTASHWKSHIAALSGEADRTGSALQIDEVRERLQEVCSAAEARLRLLIRQIAPVPLVEAEPAWLEDALSEVDASAVNPRVLDSARRLVRAVLAAGASHAEARFEATPEGGLEIAWDTPSQLTWTIGLPPFSWPGVRVRAFARKDVHLPALEARSFFLAHRVVQHAVAFIDAGAEEG